MLGYQTPSMIPNSLVCPDFIKWVKLILFLFFNIIAKLNKKLFKLTISNFNKELNLFVVFSFLVHNLTYNSCVIGFFIYQIMSEC